AARGEPLARPSPPEPTSPLPGVGHRECLLYPPADRQGHHCPPRRSTVRLLFTQGSWPICGKERALGRLINNHQIAQNLTMADTLAVLEDMSRELGRGAAVYRARTDLHTPTTTTLGPDTPSAHYLKSMDGVVPSRQAAAIRLTSDVVA